MKVKVGSKQEPGFGCFLFLIGIALIIMALDGDFVKIAMFIFHK